ncbi:hypothetical protein QW71_03805 [Paenibacillus sp. IHB B 3415]|uniref:MerR family transcriptional regulator n=1 Tax=Paenibacillus sp. IHB B 3415 TaxID=867080 RepID=UPI00057448DD|nr:MerR family transcriptional regulator [Paenibacillus sp. IHB B 3415]KHL97045.1 hypothetical protein QW71_03805 [Paenibacillus sp. IHB B 3415]
MKYTAKDVCKILDVNRETLRYYEKIGLINPEISEFNHYRYYDDWQINFIGECKKYQSLEFTIKEVDEVFKKDNLEEFIAKVELKQSIFENKVKFYTNLSLKNERYIETLKSIPHKLNHCEIREFEECFYLPGSKNLELIFSENTLNYIPQIMDNYAFVDNAVLIPFEDHRDNTGTFMWGFSVSREWMNLLELKTEKMLHLSNQKAIYSIVDVGDRWGFNYGHFDFMKNYARNNHFQINGPIFGNLLTRINESNKYCRFLEVWMMIS